MLRRLRLASAALAFALAGPAALAAGPAPAPVVAASPASLVAGDFRLQTADGRMVDTADLVGRPYGLFFGFTRCPDICPTTLADLSGALARLPGAKDFRIYFVSVDPRDTAAETARYASVFDPRIVALGGEPQAVAEAVRSFGIRVEKTRLPGGGSSFGHSASVLLVDGDGLIADRTSLQDDADTMRLKLARLLGIPAI